MKKRWIYIGATAVVILAFAVVIAFILARRLTPQYLTQYLQAQVELETNGRYRLTIDSLGFDPGTVSVELKGITFGRDTLHNGWSGHRLLDKYDFRIELERLDVNYFKLLRYVLGNTFGARRFAIHRPVITVRENPGFPAGDTSRDTLYRDSLTASPVDTTDYFSTELSLREFDIINAGFAFYDSDHEAPLFQFDSLSTRIYRLRGRRDRPLSYRDFDFRIHHLTTRTGNFTGRLAVHGLRAGDDRVRLDSFSFRHTVGKHELNDLRGHRSSWIGLKLSDIQLEGVDFSRLLQDSTLWVRRTGVGSMQFYFFRDNTSHQPNQKYKPLPAELVRELSLPLHLDTVEIRQGDFLVEVHDEGAKTPARIHFRDLHGLFTGITNLPAELKDNPDMVADVRARVGDRGEARLTVRTPVNAPDSRFRAYGRLADIPLPELNSFFNRKIYMLVERGTLDNMEFSLKGDNAGAKGELDLEFHDLEFTRLKEYEHLLNRKPKKGIVVGLINLILPNKRSKEDDDYQPVPIDVQREPNRDIMHLILQSIEQGLFGSVGLKPAEEKEKKDR